MHGETVKFKMSGILYVIKRWGVSLLQDSLALSPSDYAEAAIVQGLNGLPIRCDSSKQKNSYYAMDRTRLFSM